MAQARLTLSCEPIPCFHSWHSLDGTRCYKQTRLWNRWTANTWEEIVDKNGLLLDCGLNSPGLPTDQRQLLLLCFAACMGSRRLHQLDKDINFNPHLDRNPFRGAFSGRFEVCDEHDLPWKIHPMHRVTVYTVYCTPSELSHVISTNCILRIKMIKIQLPAKARKPGIGSTTGRTFGWLRWACPTHWFWGTCRLLGVFHCYHTAHLQWVP